ncbi:MAG: murein hydrolase activator EnvC family protein [Acidimicrobiia bacterium]
MRRLAPLMLAVVVVGIVAVPVRASLRDELDDVKGRIGDLEARLDASQGERSALAGDVATAQRRLDALVEDLAAAESDLGEVELALTVGQQRLSELQGRLVHREAQLQGTRFKLAVTRSQAATRARNLYISGGRDLTEFVFNADEVMQVALGLQYAERLNSYSEQIVLGLKALQAEESTQAQAVAAEEDELATELASVEDRRAALADLAATVAARTEDIEDELASQRALLAGVDREIEHFEGEIDHLEREQEKIEELIRLEQSGGSAPSVLLRPVPGPITSPFGYRVHPILGTRKLHTGIDFSAAYGQDIKAAGNGRVILAQWYGGYGKAVIVDHGGGVSTLYAHQSSIDVGYGQQVTAGQVIGHVGSTGLSTGPHLHFEVREWSVPVDPMKYL